MMMCKILNNYHGFMVLTLLSLVELGSMSVLEPQGNPKYHQNSLEGDKYSMDLEESVDNREVGKGAVMGHLKFVSSESEESMNDYMFPRKRLGKRSIANDDSIARAHRSARRTKSALEFFLGSRKEKVDLEQDKRKIRDSEGEVPPQKSKSRFPSTFCDLDRDSGMICPTHKRGLYLEQFYYDPNHNRCYHFLYNGCGGNANRFSSIWECTQSCGKTSAPTRNLDSK